MSKEKKPNNLEIAAVLDRIAELLEAQGANTFRVRSYREGAESVRAAESPVALLVEDDDIQGLRSLPGIGEGLANVIAQYVREGRSEVLDRLMTEVSPAQVLGQVPGIGPDLAQRIVDELGVKSLEELEQAAHDGRLDQVEGFGERRVEMVRTSLAGMLSGAAVRRSTERQPGRASGGEGEQDQPPVDLLLEVDTEYRNKSRAGELPKIAPKRFNPEDEAWLPILRTKRGDWKFTALFSNTARAHEQGATQDWVVIYYEKGQGEDQATVVTEKEGPLSGKRVVRGRETETRKYYEKKD